MDEVRTQYRELSDREKADIQAVKEKGQELLNLLLNISSSFYPTSDGSTRSADPRCISLARTKVEEAVMWAVKGVTF